MLKNPLIALTFLMTSFATSSLAVAANWVDFENSRFGVQASVPAFGFTKDPPPTNNDGRRWLLNDGDGEFAVFGSLLAVVETFEELRQFHADILKKRGVIMSYSVSGEGWFVQSGTKDKIIYYQKYSLNTQCTHQIVNGFTAKYSADLKGFFNPIITHISRSLKGSKNGFFC